MADFTFEVDDTNPFLVNFSNESINFEEAAWDFGDGETSTEDSPSHTYTEGGTYTVTLTVTNSEGESNEASQQITITDPDGNTGENVVEGGDMENEEAWTVYAGADAAMDYEFTDSVLSFSGTTEPEEMHKNRKHSNNMAFPPILCLP